MQRAHGFVAYRQGDRLVKMARFAEIIRSTAPEDPLPYDECGRWFHQQTSASPRSTRITAFRSAGVSWASANAPAGSGARVRSMTGRAASSRSVRSALAVPSSSVTPSSADNCRWSPRGAVSRGIPVARRQTRRQYRPRPDECRAAWCDDSGLEYSPASSSRT